MKKGLINIIIIVLLLTNIALTALMAFAVLPAMSSANRLVGKVADAIDLRKTPDEDTGVIGIDDTEVFSFEDKIIANLKGGGFTSIKMVFKLNKKDDGYSKYKDKINEHKDSIKSEVITIVGQYSNDNIMDNKPEISQKILTYLQEQISNNTKFIYEVGFSEFLIQKQ